uniref:CUB domain-containing protein n=1 Tax=Magallana gigas TaxID=29159 RepID=A0A8W8JVD2_MAGGI
MINVFALVYQVHLTASIEGDSLSNQKEIDATRNYSGGIITSPGFPGNYTHNASYTWTFKTGNPKSIVHLTFDFFQIFEYQNHTPRCKDFLQVNRTVPCCKLAFNSCGTLKRFNLSITGSVITISFVSNSVHSAKGFHLNWIVFIPEKPTTSLEPLFMSKTTLATNSSSSKYASKTFVFIPEKPTTSLEPLLMSTKTSTTETKTLITRRTTLAKVSSTSKYASKTYAHTGRTTHDAWFLTNDATQKISTFVQTLSDNDQSTSFSAVYLIVGICVAELTLIAFGIYMYCTTTP